MKLIAPEIPMPAEPESRLLLIPSPSMAALSRFVALDIEDSWWSSLWKGRTSASSYGEQIETLIKGEFQPVADELVATAERVLNAYATTSCKWSFGLCVNIIQAVTRRRVQLMAKLGTSGDDARANAVGQGSEHGQQTLLTERLNRIRAVSHQLEIVLHDLGHSRQPQTEAAQ
jgi:hypothetical protein